MSWGEGGEGTRVGRFGPQFCHRVRKEGLAAIVRWAGGGGGAGDWGLPVTLLILPQGMLGGIG